MIQKCIFAIVAMFQIKKQTEFQLKGDDCRQNLLFYG